MRKIYRPSTVFILVTYNNDYYKNSRRLSDTIFWVMSWRHFKLEKVPKKLSLEAGGDAKNGQKWVERKK